MVFSHISELQVGLDKTAMALIKWPSALIKWPLALIKLPSGLKMLFLPADKFFIRGHMNLAIRGPNLGDLAIGLPLGKMLDNIKGSALSAS